MRILVADDHGIVRAGIRLLLERQPGMEVVAEAQDGVEAVAHGAGASAPTCASSTSSMPRLTGLQAAREIRAQLPDARVLMLSMHDDERYLFEALKAGASGYVLKREADHDLVEAVRAVQRGEAFLTNAAERSIIREWMADASKGPTVPLTPREEEVVKLIAEAHTNAQIAEILHLAEKTIESHRANVLRKLGMRDRVRAGPLRDPARADRGVGKSPGGVSNRRDPRAKLLGVGADCFGSLANPRGRIGSGVSPGAVGDPTQCSETPEAIGEAARPPTRRPIALPSRLVRPPVDHIAAPPFPAHAEWINVAMLRMDQQRGRPVLIEFWDFCRPNSLRTLPYVKAWHERYEAAGLRVIGVHTAGFDALPRPRRGAAGPCARLGIRVRGGDRRRAGDLAALRQPRLACALPVQRRRLPRLLPLRRGRPTTRPSWRSRSCSATAGRRWPRCAPRTPRGPS